MFIAIKSLLISKMFQYRYHPSILPTAADPICRNELVPTIIRQSLIRISIYSHE